jgi:hypothetical protein
MPNCFTLTRKGEDKPATFVSIDEELCEHFNMPCDFKQYLWNWYDIIGLALACGKSLEWCQSEEAGFGEKMRAVAAYLEKHYDSDAWSQRW